MRSPGGEAVRGRWGRSLFARSLSKPLLADCVAVLLCGTCSGLVFGRSGHSLDLAPPVMPGVSSGVDPKHQASEYPSLRMLGRCLSRVRHFPRSVTNGGALRCCYGSSNRPATDNLLNVSAELIAAIIAAVAAFSSAAIALYGQVRIAKYQGRITQAVENQRFLQSQYADIGAYCNEQNAALREAYITFFEREGSLDADGATVGRLASRVDGEVMRPLRKYEALLDEETRAKVYQVHNVIAQLRGTPSAETIDKFKNFRNQFYSLIEEAREVLKPTGVLSRTGISK
jgi:hypothetical protein